MLKSGFPKAQGIEPSNTLNPNLIECLGIQHDKLPMLQIQIPKDIPGGTVNVLKDQSCFSKMNMKWFNVAADQCSPIDLASPREIQMLKFLFIPVTVLEIIIDPLLNI